MVEPRRFTPVFVFWLVTLGCTESESPNHCAELREAVAQGGEGGQAEAPDAAGQGGHAGSAETPSPAARQVSDEYAQSVSIAVHERVRTVLVVTWTQALAAEEAWLEFGFEDGELLRSPAKPGFMGEHREVVLGVPAETDVTLRLVSSAGGTEYVSSDYQATTGALPSGMPVAAVFADDPARRSPERWLFGSVEDSVGGADFGYYLNTFWLYIMDRRGRIVWYYADPATNATSSFQRVARDGQYFWIEKRSYNGKLEQSVLKMTLDWEYFEEIPVPGLSDCIDVTDDGGLLYDAEDELRERTASGEVRHIWNCRSHFGSDFDCYTNTVNWYAPDDTILLSFPYENTVVEIDRQSGAIVGQYGSARGSWEFAPPLSAPPAAWAFSFQHFPNRTPAGTLLVSSHVPGCGRNSVPGPHRHAFLEFELDRDARQLVEKWRYTEGLEWPRAKGMAIRVSNGNTLGNYGTGGVIRELSPDGQTVFGVKFDVPEGDDFFNKMVGHNVLLDDLYALNGGR